MLLRPFRVYTFCEKRPGRKDRISACTLWENREWAGCITYDVEAVNGTEAKKQAIELRRLDEIAYREYQADIRVV